DDKVEALGRAGRGRRDVRAELDRALRAGRRELHDPEAVIEAEVGVEPPTEVPIELLRVVDIRDGNDDGLELQVDVLNACVADRVVTTEFIDAHSCLLCCVAMTVALSPFRRTIAYVALEFYTVPA